MFFFDEDDNESCFPNLSWKERILGFTLCFLLGMLIEIASFSSILGIFVGSPGKFAFTYTLANLILLIGFSNSSILIFYNNYQSTGFLVGFDKQYRSMKKDKRLFSSLIYIGSSIGVLISALFFDSAILVMILLLVSVSSFVWYIASYIPFARECLISLFNKLFRQPEPESIY